MSQLSWFVDRDVSTSSATATLGDHVVEPIIVQSTKQSPSFFLPSELLLVDDAVQDLGSGMLTDQVYQSVNIKFNYLDTAIIGSTFEVDPKFLKG